MRGRNRFAARVLAALVAAGWAAVGVPATLAHADPAPSNDPGSALQWHLSAIGAPAAWAAATGRGATIAIVDTGIDLQHEDLADGKVAAAVTCLDTGGDEAKCVDGGQDDDGHGTHVAGIAAANGNNGKGVIGVAPDATLLSVKVLRETCGGVISTGCDATGTAADVEAGITWAADHGATVINLSLGSTTQAVFGPGFAQAIEYAWSKGAISVVAAGNDFILSSGFKDEPAIVVDALDRSGGKAAYSNGVGPAHWALSAPGGERDDAQSCTPAPNGILSTYWSKDSPTDAYACLAGTSMAAPQVSGAAAVLRSAGLSAVETVDRLLASARDIGPAGADTTFGAGALDLAAATAGLTTGPAGATPPVAQGTTTVPAAPPSTDAPPTSADPNTVPGSSTTTIPPVVALPSTTAPATSEQVAVRLPGPPSHDELPPGWVTAAVLLAGGVGAASGWMLVRGSDWTRRTPG